MYNVRRTHEYYSREAQLLDILARDYDRAGYYGDDLLKEAGIFDSLVSRFRGLGSRAAGATAGASGSTATVATAAPTTRFNPMNSQAPEMFADTVGVAPLRRNLRMRMQAIPEGQIPMSAPRVDPLAQTQAVPLQQSAATMRAPSPQIQQTSRFTPVQQPTNTMRGAPVPEIQQPVAPARAPARNSQAVPVQQGAPTRPTEPVRYQSQYSPPPSRPLSTQELNNQLNANYLERQKRFAERAESIARLRAS
jgi:hypothetical protein